MHRESLCIEATGVRVVVLHHQYGVWSHDEMCTVRCSLERSCGRICAHPSIDTPHVACRTVVGREQRINMRPTTLTSNQGIRQPAGTKGAKVVVGKVCFGRPEANVDRNTIWARWEHPGLSVPLKIRTSVFSLNQSNSTRINHYTINLGSTRNRAPLIRG